MTDWKEAIFGERIWITRESCCEKNKIVWQERKSPGFFDTVNDWSFWKVKDSSADTL